MLLLAIFGVTASSGENIETALRVSMPAAAVAGLAVLIASAALVFGKEQRAAPWGLVSYSLSILAIGLLIDSTGAAFSPYIALWLLLAVFSGLFGLYGVLALALIANAYTGWHIIDPTVELATSRLAIFILATNLPLAISFIIWHKQRDHGSGKEKREVSALTKQLTEVSGKSEIVINSIADGVIVVDSKGVIQLINPAAQTLTGWSEEEALNLDYSAVLKLVDKHDQQLAPGQSPIDQVKIGRGSLVNNELTLISKAAKKMVVSLVVSPVLQEKEVAAVVVVFRDITREKAREREQAEFISTASHEMRTPVAAIEGYLGLVSNPQTATIDDKARLYLEKAQEAVKHLGRLFQDLLTVSRAEDSRLEDHPQVTDIVAFLGTVTEGLTPKAEEKGIKLNFKPYSGRQAGNSEQKLTPVFYGHVDRDHLREVSANLIENGIKYTKEGKVVVDVGGDDKRVTISIQDSGIGIPREDIPHLFQKFYRVDNSDTREIGGTGLGLYISRRLVESLRGRIWVESEPGKGSTFFIALPRISNLDVKHIQESEAIEQLQRKSAGSVSGPVVPAAAAISSMPPSVDSAASTALDAVTPAAEAEKDPAEPVPKAVAPPEPETAPEAIPAPEPEKVLAAAPIGDIIPPVSSTPPARRGQLNIPGR